MEERGMTTRWLLLAAITLSHAGSALSIDDRLPPPPVHSPTEELKTFQLAEPDCRIELIAAEPMVQDPVAIAFDGNGRLWVAEMRGFMRDIDRTGVNDLSGRVSVLEDLDGDGRMDKATVFADQLVLPRALSIQPDGVLVAESKALWFMQDLDGDLRADRKLLIDANYARDNIEHSANGLLRALDNRFYNAKEGHCYRRESGKWIREGTEERGQWGISQDDWGRLCYNYNHSQLHADLVPPGAFSRNPNHSPSTGLSVGVAGSNQVFPIRPTPAANRAYIPGALDEHARIKQFTSACAPWIYRGALFREFAGNAFVCEPVGNLIKRNVLTNGPLEISSTFAYPDREFLASTDERFRPVALTTGPDGALYIADMYRGVIQDGPHMSPYLREHHIARHMDKPIHLGRIWRIVPKDFQQPPAPNFAAMDVSDLVATLAHPDGWWRDTAQCHLVVRNLREAVPALRKLALQHDNPNTRLHALWTLEGLKDPDPTRLLPALKDESPRVIANALRVLQSLQLPSNEWHAAIRELSSADPAPEVALQLLLTLGDLKLNDAERLQLMADILLPRVSDPLMRDATLSSLARKEAAFIKLLLHHASEEEDPFLAFLLESLSTATVRSRDQEQITWLLEQIETEPAWVSRALWNGISVNAPLLASRPITLFQDFSQHSKSPRLKQLFAWPGHRPPPRDASQARPLTKGEAGQFARGRQIYLTVCIACHGQDGHGMKMLAPPLAGSDWVNGGEQRLVRVMLHGLRGPLTVRGKHYDAPAIQPEMPPLAVLNNGDIAAVLTYIRREWDNTADPVAERTVSRIRIETQGRTTPWTEAELQPFAKLSYPAEN